MPQQPRTTTTTPRVNHGAASRRRGAMLVLVALMMLGFMVAVAFSVDIAQMHLARTELRTATDAAAKASAETLSRTLDVNQAIARGQELAYENSVIGKPLIIPASDFSFGHSHLNDAGRFEFRAGELPLNSVRVIGRRAVDAPSGAVQLSFGNLLGVGFFEPEMRGTATFMERDVVLVIDRSGSMQGSKFTELRDAISIFVQTLGETPVVEYAGLASYSDNATVDVTLTDDLPRISQKMAELVPGGFTSISMGMLAGQQILEQSRSADIVERTMIVMTDGLHNRGAEPSTVANSLAASGVKIHTVTFGADADLPRMEAVAQIGGGRHFHAVDGDGLREIYREIAMTLTTMITE